MKILLYCALTAFATFGFTVIFMTPKPEIIHEVKRVPCLITKKGDTINYYMDKMSFQVWKRIDSVFMTYKQN